jgi:hypothetical protein
MEVNVSKAALVEFLALVKCFKEDHTEKQAIRAVSRQTTDNFFICNSLDGRRPANLQTGSTGDLVC